MITEIEQNKWVGIELHIKKNTFDAEGNALSNGVVKVWYYNEQGEEIGYWKNSSLQLLIIFKDHKYNKLELGGNADRSRADTEGLSYTTWMYFDDVIVDDHRIGPAYFALLKNQPVITAVSLPGAVFNQPYSQFLQVTGGTPSYTWQITAGSLPQGLTLDVNSGEITGIADKEGAYTFTVEVRDAESKIASKELFLTVVSAEVKEDINADGKVDVLDVQVCVNVILGLESNEAFVNKIKVLTSPEAECTVSDLQAVVNKVLGVRDDDYCEIVEECEYCFPSGFSFIKLCLF